jgi:chromate transport protein ChrA
VILLNIPLSVSGLIAVAVMLYILAMLSRRLGAVTKMKPYYRGFYLAMAGVIFALVSTLLRQSDADADLSVYVFVYYLPLILSGLISLVVAYRYWGWLFRERIK